MRRGPGIVEQAEEVLRRSTPKELTVFRAWFLRGQRELPRHFETCQRFDLSPSPFRWRAPSGRTPWNLDAQACNRQMEEDVAVGRLDHLADEVIREFHDGRCTELWGTGRPAAYPCARPEV